MFNATTGRGEASFKMVVIVSIVINKILIIKHWWNDNDRRKPKYQSHYLYVHHKCYTD
jgi:hypothetical protein